MKKLLMTLSVVALLSTGAMAREGVLADPIDPRTGTTTSEGQSVKEVTLSPVESQIKLVVDATNMARNGVKPSHKVTGGSVKAGQNGQLILLIKHMPGIPDTSDTLTATSSGGVTLQSGDLLPRVSSSALSQVYNRAKQHGQIGYDLDRLY